MNRILLKSAMALTISGAAVSCQESTFDTAPTADGLCQSISDDTDPFIGNEKELTPSDAEKVSRLFFKGKYRSRANSDIAIKNIVTIQDDNGDPAIYAVNFDDGYLLVSASKSYYPILAQVDHGTFTLDDTPSGRDVIIQDMLAEIKATKDSTNDFGCEPMWTRYEKPVQLANQVMSRSFQDDDAYWEMRNKWDAIWYQQGASVYYLNRSQDVVPEDIWNYFWEKAVMDDNCLGTGYEATNAAIVTVREFNPNTVSEYGPYLTTTWNQVYPYNYSDPQDRKLGCVTIAVGQLMKYYQHPASYNWASMPNSIFTYNSTLCPFLYTLRQELNTKDNGATTLSEANKVLKNYGYNCSIKSHNETDIRNSIRSKNPVLVGGTDKSTGEGHAWVIDGYSYQDAYKLYTLYFIAGWKFPDLDYEEVDARKEYLSYGSYFYHHNWGWGGLNDGWYFSATPYITIDNERYNFDSNKSTIIVTSHK